MRTALTVLAILVLVDLVLVALRIAAVEARPVHRCLCGAPAKAQWCKDCTAQLALSPAIHAMRQR